MVTPEGGAGTESSKQHKPTDKANFATVRDAFVERAKAVRDSGDEDAWVSLLVDAGNYSVDRWIAQAAIAVEDCSSEVAWKRAQLREIDNLTFGNLARLTADADEALQKCRSRHASVIAADSVAAIGQGLSHELDQIKKAKPHRWRSWLIDELVRIGLTVLVLSALAGALRVIPAGINSQGRHLSDELFGQDPAIAQMERQLQQIEKRLPAQ